MNFVQGVENMCAVVGVGPLVLGSAPLLGGGYKT